jgi:hypothetical protein
MAKNSNSNNGVEDIASFIASERARRNGGAKKLETLEYRFPLPEASPDGFVFPMKRNDDSSKFGPMPNIQPLPEMGPNGIVGLPKSKYELTPMNNSLPANSIAVPGPDGQPMRVPSRLEAGNKMSVDYRNLAAAGANPSQSLLNVNKGQQSAMPAAGNAKPPMQQGYKPEQPASLESYPNIPTMLRGPSNAPMQPGYQQPSLMTGTSPDIPQYLRKPEAQTEQAINQQQAVASQTTTGTTAQPTQPTLSPQQQAQDRARSLRQQIAIEQKNMQADRRARGGMYGDGGDAEALKKIQGLRNELNQYERAGQSVQQAQTPEQYAERAQQFASSAATEIGNQIQKEITAASYLPEGSPQRQAANARIQKMQEYARQQQSVGEALPFNIPGPQPEGAKPVEYSQAVAATQRQQAMAEENMRRRAMDLTEAQKTTAKRELGEQREKDVAAAEQQAKIANINAPERERQQKEKLIEAQIGEIGARTKNATEEIDLKRRAAALAESQANYAKDPQNPKNISDMAQAQVAQMEVERRKAVMAGATGLKTSEEIQRDLTNSNAQLEETGISGPNGFESQALAAATAIASEIGGMNGTTYTGSMFTGNARGGIEASNKINSYAQQLEVLAKVNPKLAQQKARMFLNITPQQMTGSGASMISEAATGILLGAGVVAAPFTGGTSLLVIAAAGAAGALALGGAEYSNESQRNQVVNNFNNARQTLERLASGQQ